MSFWHRLLPAYAPHNLRNQGSLAVLRDQILQNLLLGLSALGLVAVAVGIYVAYDDLPILAIIYTLVYLLILFITFQREWPYRLRALTIVVTLYLISLTVLYDGAILGEVIFWMEGAVVIAALLLGFRTAMMVCATGVLTLITVGLGTQFNWLYLPDAQYLSVGANFWIDSVLLVFLSITVSASTTALVDGLQRMAAEKETLVTSLENERQSLEHRIHERTIDLQRRLSQVRTAAEISNAIGRIATPETLFQQVVDLIQSRLDLYYAGLFIVDELRQYATLQAGSGEAGQLMRSRGHRLPLSAGSMIGWAITNRQARIALDVGTDAVRFNNPVLPLTRSELALPILRRGEAIGALTVQSAQSEAFDQNDILVLQGIADGLSAAIENARLVGELKQNLDELSALNRNYVRDGWRQLSSEKGQQEFAFEKTGTSSPPQASLEIPILLRDQAIAQLSLDLESGQLSEEERAFLDAITTQTALALENARLVQNTEMRVAQEQRLNEMSARFSRTMDLENIVRTAAEELGHLPTVTEVVVELVAPSALQAVIPTAQVPPENKSSSGNLRCDNNGHSQGSQ